MQEREAIREREPEPKASSYEWRYGNRARTRLELTNGLVVVRGKDRPWEVSPQSRGKYLLWPRPAARPGVVDEGPPWSPDWAEVCVPNWMMFLHDIRTTPDGITTSGQHRHQGGLGLFAVEGEGWSVVDAVRHDWRAGDFIMLPIKPGGCIHQHFAKPGTEAMWLAIAWEPYGVLTGAWVEQLKVGSLNVPPPQWTQIVAGLETAEDALKRLAPTEKAPASEDRKGLYGEMLRLRDAERERLKKAIIVARGDKAPTEINPMGVIHWYTHPALDEPALRTYMLWVQEIPVGSRSGRMRHQGGRIHYVWQGQGYTVVDGVRHEWEQGDVICIPLKAFGVEYQHFNGGDQPAKLVTIELNMVGSMGVDLGAPWEVIEPAPEYRAAR